MTRHIENVAAVGTVDVRRRLYLSAQRLGIEEWEREGIALFVERARAGAFTLCRASYRYRIGPLPSAGFDMRNACMLHSCGTVACFGGYVYLLARGSAPRNAASYVDSRRNHPSLGNAYFPAASWPYESGPQAVANVAEHMLLTGIVDWSVAR